MPEIQLYDVDFLSKLLYKMRRGEILQYTQQVEEIFEKFSFEMLVDHNIVDYRLISSLTCILQVFVRSSKFKQKVRYYFTKILDFALNNACFFVKSNTVTSNSLLKGLLELINEILISIQNVSEEVRQHIDEERITDLLINLSREKPQMLKIGGMILANLISLPNPTKKMSIVVCISKIFSLLLKMGATAESNLICAAVLRNRWTSNSSVLQTAMIDYAKNDVTKQLISTKCEFDLSTVINVLNAIYQTRCSVVSFKFSEALKTSLDVLCKSTSLDKAEVGAKQLLTFILHDLSKEIIPGCFTVCQEINWNLPQNYEDWPNSNNEVLLLMIYFMNLYSRVIWEDKAVLRYLLNKIFEMSFTLPKQKILLHLFPLYALNRPGHEIYLATNILMQSLEGVKYLHNVLTYTTVQMTWVLIYASPYMKVKILSLWLNVENDDRKILPALDGSKSGSFLLNALFTNPYLTDLSKRWVPLLSKLKDRNFSDHVSKYLKLGPLKPQVFPYILQICCSSTISVEKNLALYYAQITALHFSTFTEEDMILGACRFTFGLLVDHKHESKMFLSFATNRPTIMFLVNLTSQKKDLLALEAAKVLAALIKLQVKHSLKVNTIYLDFCLLLMNGSNDVLLKMLKMIYLVLKFPQDGALFDMRDSSSYLSLYYRLQELALQKELSSISFHCLRLSLYRKRPLAYSMSSLAFIRAICTGGLTTVDTSSFLSYLGVFLKACNCFHHWRFPKMEINMFLEINTSPAVQYQVRSCQNILKTIPDGDSY